MTTDEEKDQKLERDIINAVKARGLQESMERWAKSAPKRNRRLKGIDIVLISAAAVVLVLIVVNVAVVIFQPVSAPEEEGLLYCLKKEDGDTIVIQESDTAVQVKTKVSKTDTVITVQGEQTPDESTIPAGDYHITKNSTIAKITFPEITLRRYRSIRFFNAPEDDDPIELMRQAEIHWNANDFAGAKQYSQRVIEALGKSEHLGRYGKEMLEYAEVYNILAIAYLENPNFKESTIQELERVSQMSYPECEQVKAVLECILDAK